MTELQPYFTHRDRSSTYGISYSQINISTLAYIYKKVNLSTNKTSYLAFQRWEDESLGRVIFPSSHEIGIWAWEFETMPEATAKFQELNSLLNLMEGEMFP